MINSLSLLLLIVMTWCGAIGSVLFKTFTASRSTFVLMTGLLSYGLGALLNIVLLAYLPYTMVIPANALTFIWTLLLAKVVFRERVGIFKLAGIACIVSGVLLLLV